MYMQYPVNCGCVPERFHRNCLFYSEESDMGARIHFCTDTNEIIEDCNQCMHFISYSDAVKMIKEKRISNGGILLQ